MQAFTDVPVKCCDCKETFLSASSLLQHFAQHVKIDLLKSNHEILKSVRPKSHSCRNKKDLNGNKKLCNLKENVFIPNNVDRNNVNLCNSLTSNDSSLQSVCSDKSEINSFTESSDSKSSYNIVNAIDDDVITENAQQLPSTVSLQEKHNEVTDHLLDKNVSKQFCVEFNSAKMLINVEKLPSKDNLSKNVSQNLEIINNKEPADKVLSLNENDIKIDGYNKQKLSNRKQLKPKKIERTTNGLIKIAPRPEDMPINYGREVQNKKSKKKYNCHLCSKVFGWSTDLKRHILVHTGERPFKCPKCSACFTRNFLLQKHKSKIHPCNKEFIEKNKLLEEKVNENLKQLRSKMTEFEKIDVKIENSAYNEFDDEDKELINNFEEEMNFEESKLSIKDELYDPLGDVPLSPEPQESFVNGNWILTKNNEHEQLFESGHKEIITVQPIKIMS